MVIGANVHAIGFSTSLPLTTYLGKVHLRLVLCVFTVYQWSLAGDISQQIAQPYVRWGIVTLGCFDLLGLFSIRCVRTKSYNLFFGTHVVGLIVALFAVGSLYSPPLARLTVAVL